MLSAICKQTIQTNLQRSSRCVSSVFTPPNVPDFQVKNEPILGYLKGSPERAKLEAALKDAKESCEEVPIVIGDTECTSKDVRYQVMPHCHGQKIAKFYYADKKLIERAIDTAVKAQKEWDATPIEDRIALWMKAADLMAGEHRQQLNAATMLGQSKTAFQAEIDSACELVDFFRFNAYFLKEALKYQPISEDAKVTKNWLRYRGFEGFVAAVSPFNFTAIGGNLASAPALLGNSVLWKPSDTAVLSNYRIFQICRRAGIPPGVINFVPCDGPVFGDTITASRYLAGINFTGSVPTFARLWCQVGANVSQYINFPRLIGEVGGKNFHFVHPSADVTTVAPLTIRSAFEFCGQKCSACSRMYAPKSLWPQLKEALLAARKELRIGDPTDYATFAGAVIDKRAFERISGYIHGAKKSSCLQVIAGGKCDDSTGYFIEPTIVETRDPTDKIMVEEIFGPVLTVYVYNDAEIEEAMDLVGSSTQFALTGAIFAQDEAWLKKALEHFKMAAGNFYINDKSTGAVVGQQPFGGARMSGTNDKAGGPYYPLRWGNPQAIKETFVPLRDVTYPYMSQ